jgi:hypothetical protein
MKQTEIDEISVAFKEAWVDYFGTEMYYVPFDRNSTTVNSIYQESKGKKYLYDSKMLFHGTIKELQHLDTGRPTGKRTEKFFEITFVTKELLDLGLLHVDTDDIIQYSDRFGREYTLLIYDDFQKVQLVDNKIFTKLLVRSKTNG